MAGRTLEIALALGCVGFAWGRATAQDGAMLSLAQELERLGAAAESLEHALPSFTCQQTAMSEYLSGGKAKEHDEFTATMRAKRAADGTLAETSELTKLNGRPFSGNSFRFPFYVSGGFDRGMRYFTPEKQACYRYSLSPGRIDFETAADVAAHTQCTDEGLKGFALLDADGNVSHLERTVTSKAEKERGLAPFASIDFGAVELNGKTFRLSRHVFSESVQGRFVLRFEATYSECRLFTVTVKIGPEIEAEPDGAHSGDAPAPPHP